MMLDVTGRRWKMRTLVLSSLVLALPFSSVLAVKDGDYYIGGFENPNTKHEMYWKDSHNVLQDLDQFSALYITYHRCVWTKFGKRYGSGQNYDEQGQDEPDDDYPENGCGGFGGEYFWYMGRTQCFKANVAYSLYGVLLASDAGDSSSRSPCNRHTYINSFFTTYGPESFTGPLGMGVDTINSYCTAIAPDNPYLNTADDAAADDDYLNTDEYVFYDYPAYESYGTGCNKDGSFVTDSYTGAFCHGRNYVATLDTLEDWNAQLRGMECTQIYGAGEELEDKNDEDDDGDYEFENMDAINILAFSKSCSLRQYPKDCPDPFGLKQKYARAIHNAFYLKHSGRSLAALLMNGLAMMALCVGGTLLSWAYMVYRRTTLRKALVTLREEGDDDGDDTTVKSGESSRRRNRKRRKSRRSRSGDRNKPEDATTTNAASEQEPNTAEPTAASAADTSLNTTSSSHTPSWSSFRKEQQEPFREVVEMPLGERVERVAVSQTGIRSQPWVASADSRSITTAAAKKKRSGKAGSFSKFFVKKT